MPRFYRVTHSPHEIHGRAKDAALDDGGFVWRFLRGIGWRIERRLLNTATHRLIDTPGAPTIRNGKDGDAAVNPDGWCFTKAGGQWNGDGCLVVGDPKDATVGNLRVDGNFSVPVIDGRIPVYNRQGALIGEIAVLPPRKQQ